MVARQAHNLKIGGFQSTPRSQILMPGQLRLRARCPRCSDPLCAIVDTSNSAGVTREYFHDRWPGASPKARTKRRCIYRFTDHDLAAAERFALETHAVPKSPRQTSR